MASTGKVFAGEMVVAMAINSWGALKAKQVPYPAQLIRTILFFALLSFVAMVDEDLAEWLGAGVLVALIIAKVYSPQGGISNTFGAQPPRYDSTNFPFYTLHF